MSVNKTFNTEDAPTTGPWEQRISMQGRGVQSGFEKKKMQTSTQES